MWVRASTLRASAQENLTPGDSYASTHLIRCIVRRSLNRPTSARTEERAGEWDKRARWQHEEEETPVCTMNGRERQVGYAKHNAGVGPCVRPTRRILRVALFSSLVFADVTLRELRHLLFRRYALPCGTALFLSSGRVVAIRRTRIPACASVSSYPRRRVSRPRYLARRKLLGENLEIVLRPSRSAPARSLVARQSEAKMRAVRREWAGSSRPVAFVAVIVEN